ncbi:hypothetical protein EJF36_15405 [Bacillus sp. HMF5848]|uniref:hypothetical protein n=1 Tax=Bacillus sp. HMF5848 TaxID=2495421 RepID=UPI000F7AA9DE|nr:hypothetical protein [Bacillus sp. HMF5848]RSK28156.1 hypothetical protein EJF36_15405 [Bacillus sp. HMF5848]
MTRILLIAATIFFVTNTSVGHAWPTFYESDLLQVVIVENGVETTWRYESPTRFQRFDENGRSVGWKVKQEMDDLFTLLRLDHFTKVEKMVERLKEDGYPDVEHLEVRWMKSDGQLYTWTWKK